MNEAARKNAILMIRSLALVAGWVRVLLPLVAFGAGLALLLDRGPRDDDEDDEEHEVADPWRLAVGSVLGVLGICGLAELAKGSPRFSNSAALKDAGGFPAYGNSTHDWDLEQADHPNPEYR